MFLHNRRVPCNTQSRWVYICSFRVCINWMHPLPPPLCSPPLHDRRPRHPRWGPINGVSTPPHRTHHPQHSPMNVALPLPWRLKAATCNAPMSADIERNYRDWFQTQPHTTRSATMVSTSSISQMEDT